MPKLTDDQWNWIRHFAEENRKKGRRGRPPVPARQVLEAVPWILKTGARWHMLPRCYPNYKTVHRRYRTWCRTEAPADVPRVLASELREVGVIRGEEAYIDASFARAKGGGDGVGLTKAGKGVKIMAIVDRCGLPLSIGAHSAQRHRGQDRAQLSLDRVLLDDPPRNLVGDKAYDSNPLDAEAGERGVEMIAPHRRNRTRPKTRDGRRLRRYKRRWIVERFFAWIQWNRRVLVQWEYNPENFLGFVQLAAPCLPLKLEIGSSRRGQWSPRFSRNREQLQE